MAESNNRKAFDGRMKYEVFGKPVVDRYSKSYDAIRGREQQLIDYHGGIGNKKVANKIRGVAKWNPNGRYYHSKSNDYFGNIAPYTGF